jgi:hypothetical protein
MQGRDRFHMLMTVNVLSGLIIPSLLKRHSNPSPGSYIQFNLNPNPK